MTGVDSDVITTDRTYLRLIPKVGTYTTGLVTFTQVCVWGGGVLLTPAFFFLVYLSPQYVP